MSRDGRAIAGDRSPRLSLAASLVTVLVLALLLANEEVQIEGGTGWAANLPTWRIEGGWLLDHNARACSSAQY